MKLHRQAEHFRSTGTWEEQGFTVQTGGKLFEFLQNNIYADKIAAPVRELASNAWDAHVEAGCPERPWEVHLPSALEPWFGIRDFGPGITPAQMREVYTRYLASTKEDTDAVVGQKGLGSKTPLAYTNTFSVTSWTGGVRREYAVYLREGEPRYALVHEEEAPAGETGLEVRFAVKEEDFGRFRWAALGAYEHYRPRPEVRGEPLEWPEPEILLQGDGWRLTTAVPPRRLVLVQGCVPYDVLPTNDVAPPGLQDLHRLCTLVVECPIGTFDVTLSREGIEWTDRSRRQIRALLGRVYDEIVAEAHRRAADALAMLPVPGLRVLLGMGPVLGRVLGINGSGLRRPGFRLLHSGVHFFLRGDSWPGSPVLLLSGAGIGPWRLLEAGTSQDWTRRAKPDRGPIPVPLTQSRVCIVRRDCRAVWPRVEAMQPGSILLVEGGADLRRLTTALRELGVDYTVRNLSDVPYVPKGRSTATPQAKPRVPLCYTFLPQATARRERQENCWEPCDHANARTGYVVLNRWRWLDPEMRERSPRALAQVALVLMELGVVESVVGVRPKRVRTLERQGAVPLFGPQVQAKVKAPFPRNFDTLVEWDEYSWSDWLFRQPESFYRRIREASPKSPALVAELPRKHQGDRTFELFGRLSGVHRRWLGLPESPPRDNPKAWARALRERYPLLPDPYSGADARVRQDAIAEYIILVDRHRKEESK